MTDSETTRRGTSTIEQLDEKMRSIRDRMRAFDASDRENQNRLQDLNRQCEEAVRRARTLHRRGK